MQGQEVCYPVYNINAVIAVEINLHRLLAEGLILKDRLAASAAGRHGAARKLSVFFGGDGEFLKLGFRIF